MQVGAFLSAILGTELFVAGGWVLVGLGMASFNILPLLVLPFLTNIEMKESCKRKDDSKNKESHRVGPQSIPLWPQKIAFYFPDVVLFLNHTVCDLMMYVLPAKILYSSTFSLNSAVKLLRIFSIASFISALTLSFIAGRIKKFNIIPTLALGNVCYHIGAVVAFGATTFDFKFFDFTYQLVIGIVLMGLGEACHINLYTPSKFSLYEKWSLDNRSLGEQSAKMFNIVLSLAAALGTVLSALVVTSDGRG